MKLRHSLTVLFLVIGCMCITVAVANAARHSSLAVAVPGPWGPDMTGGTPQPLIVSGGPPPTHSAPATRLGTDAGAGPQSATSGPATYSPSGLWMDLGKNGTVNDPNGPLHPKPDANGILMLPQGSHGTYVYNPVYIAQWALQEWDYYFLGAGNQHLVTAQNAANWFISNETAGGGIPYHFPWWVGGMGGIVLNAGWTSAMAQGEALSLFARLYSVTADPKYASAAALALAPLSQLVSKGGLEADFLGNPAHPWYEEYPTTPANFTLNGFEYTLLGLYDWASGAASASSSAPQAKTLYQSGMASLTYALRFYDLGDKTAYHLGDVTDFQPILSSTWYHMIHTRMLDLFSTVESTNAALALYRDRWQSYPPCQSAVGKIVCTTFQ